MSCGCGGKKANQAAATVDELIAAAQQRADERRAAEQQNADSQRRAIANAST